MVLLRINTLLFSRLGVSALNFDNKVSPISLSFLAFCFTVYTLQKVIFFSFVNLLPGNIPSVCNKIRMLNGA